MKKCLSIMMICALCLTACSVLKMPMAEDRIIAGTQSCYAIPGFYESDWHSVKADIIDEDNYGRMLFAVSARGMNAVGICQKHTDSAVYYYDNINYVYTDEYNECSTEMMEKLKSANDWNKPEFDDSKMVKRWKHNQYDFGAYIMYGNTMHEECSKIIDNTLLPNYDENCICKMAFCDRSKTGQELFFIQISATTDENGTVDDYYLLLLNPDGTCDSETQLLKIDDIHNSNETLARIKEQNGWEG